MFQHITGASDTAHATVASRRGIDFLHPARFMSEFAACTAADTEDCRTPTPDATVAALRLSDWQPVQWNPADDAPCTETLDWPVQRVVLVDRDEPPAVREPPAFCNVYDRLPPFEVAPCLFASARRLACSRRSG